MKCAVQRGHCMISSRLWHSGWRWVRPLANPIWLLPVAAIVLLCPLLLNQYQLHVVTVVLIYVPLVLGQNLITGNSGQVSMAHGAFYGVGAYATAILAGTYGWSTLAVLVVGMVAAGFLGLLIGLPAIRISGDYLFIVTIGVNLAFLDVASQWVSVTGGTSGLPGLPEPAFGSFVVGTYVRFYYFALIMAAVALAITAAVVHSRFGTVVEAVRDDPVAARACGISLTPVRVAVFAIGAALAGLAGVTLGYFIGFVGPYDFGVEQSLLIFLMAILGGLGSIPGSIAGAAILVGLPEALRFLQPYRLGLVGFLMMVLMIYRPQGLLGRVNATNLIRK